MQAAWITTEGTGYASQESLQQLPPVTLRDPATNPPSARNTLHLPAAPSDQHLGDEPVITEAGESDVPTTQLSTETTVLCPATGRRHHLSCLTEAEQTQVCTPPPAAHNTLEVLVTPTRPCSIRC